MTKKLNYFLDFHGLNGQYRHIQFIERLIPWNIDQKIASIC